MRRVFLWISAVASSLVALGVVLQVYFIGSWIFGAADALDAHRDNALVVWILGIVVGLSGLVAYWRAWGPIAVSIALPILTEIQIFFVGDVEDPSTNESGWLHGFHGGRALFVFVLAAWIARRDFKALGVGRRTAIG